MNRNPILILVAVVLGTAYWAYSQYGNSESDVAVRPPIVKVTMPPSLSAKAQTGQERFKTNCASCHGINAAGQDGVAPPLVHKIYEPNHHADESFQRAVAMGVRAHHWSFGNMPATDGLDRKQVSEIVIYMRELQRANGIY